MTLDALIDKAAATGLVAGDVDVVAVASGQSHSHIIQACVRLVAERFLRGTYSWEFGNAAMNGLYGFAYVVTETQLSPFSFAAYEAFDAGEVAVDGDSRTRDLLRRAFIAHAPNTIDSPSA